MQPTPVFLPGESHGRRSLVGYSPRDRKESDTTEQLHFHFKGYRKGEILYDNPYMQTPERNDTNELTKQKLINSLGELRERIYGCHCQGKNGGKGQLVSLELTSFLLLFFTIMYISAMNIIKYTFFTYTCVIISGFSGGTSGKEPICQ